MSETIAASEPTPTVIPYSDPEMQPSVHFMFETIINDYLPPFTFSVSEINVDKNEFFYEYTYQIDISCQHIEEYTSQSLYVISNVKWNTENRDFYINITDSDFDGFADIRVTTSTAHNNTYDFYRWNVQEGGGHGCFETKPYFSLFARGYELYPDTKQIISYIHAGAGMYSRETYQLRQVYREGCWIGEYDLVRIEDVKYAHDEDDGERYKDGEFLHTYQLPAI